MESFLFFLFFFWSNIRRWSIENGNFLKWKWKFLIFFDNGKLFEKKIDEKFFKSLTLINEFSMKH